MRSVAYERGDLLRLYQKVNRDHWMQRHVAPTTGELMKFPAPLPDDMRIVLDKLEGKG